jgi:hypothetical protein
VERAGEPPRVGSFIAWIDGPPAASASGSAVQRRHVRSQLVAELELCRAAITAMP